MYLIYLTFQTYSNFDIIGRNITHDYFCTKKALVLYDLHLFCFPSFVSATKKRFKGKKISEFLPFHLRTVVFSSLVGISYSLTLKDKFLAISRELLSSLNTSK